MFSGGFILEKNPFKYIPYENYGNFTDPLPSWPEFTPVKPVNNYTLRLLREDPKDFIAFSRCWRDAYPELYGGIMNDILHPEYYHRLFGHRETFLKGYYSAFVFEDNMSDTIFGGSLTFLDFTNRAAQAVLLAVSPSYRHTYDVGRFLYLYSEHFDRFLEATGIEYAWSAVVANHRVTQKMLKHIGYKVRGVVPGMGISAINTVHYRRDNYVYMDRFYNQGLKRVPEKMDLIGEAEKIWKLSECEKRES